MKRPTAIGSALLLALTLAGGEVRAQEPPGTYADAPFNQGTIFYSYHRAQARRSARLRGPAPRRAAAPVRPYPAVRAGAPARSQWFWNGRHWIGR